MPNGILEGMLYGLPVVLRINGAIPAVVTHGTNGFFTASRDAEVFVGFCARIVRNQGESEAIAGANIAKAMDKFTTEKVRKRLLGIYADVGGAEQ